MTVAAGKSWNSNPVKIASLCFFSAGDDLITVSQCMETIKRSSPKLHACVSEMSDYIWALVHLSFLATLYFDLRFGAISNFWLTPRYHFCVGERKMSQLELFLYSLGIGRGGVGGLRAIYVHSHARIHRLWLVRPLWSGTAAKSKPYSGTLGLLCLILEPLALSRPPFKIHCGFKEQHSQQWGGQAWKI